MEVIDNSSKPASDSRGVGGGQIDDLDSVTSNRYLRSIERPKAEFVAVVHQKESSEGIKPRERMNARAKRNVSINVVYPHMV